MRLAFVGQATYFHYCALEEPADGVEPRFFDYRMGEEFATTHAALADWDPDVVLAFRPETLPASALDGLRAVRVGFLTEPLPRRGEQSHPDLDRRLADLGRIDPGNVDRIVCFDPLIAPTVEQIVPVWRTMAIPVADRYFAPVAEPRVTRRILFTGRSTEHRERLLAPGKHVFELAHLAHGVTDERLIDFLRESDVGINLHNEDYPTFENRVCVYMAAGLLLISELLSPPNGLVPGLDYLAVRTPDDVLSALIAFHDDAEAFRPMRESGRRKAERWRASAVYPRLARDALSDAERFGRQAVSALA